MAGDLKFELNTAIERLYEVFGTYSPPQIPAYCEHCVSDAEDRVLRTKPLRELSASELKRYSFKAISTWGTVEQFKYLLPRMFELVVTEGFGYNPEILFKKPRLAGIASWHELEREALRTFCDVLWRSALAHYPLAESLPAMVSIDDCLCSVAQIVDDLQPMLDAWDRGETANMLHVADFAAENALELRANRKLSNSFWDERPEQMKQVVDWFMGHKFADVFDVVASDSSPQEFREELVRAVMKNAAQK